MAESIHLNPASFLSMGRNSERAVCWLGWSASSLSFVTTAKQITFRLCTDAEPLEAAFLCRAAVLVDGTIREDFLLSGDRDVDLSLDGQAHTVTLVKLSEAAFGSLGVREIISDSSDLRPLPPRPRSIEFIGDSITCGYGVNASAEETFSTATENALSAYAYLTAEALNASYSLVSWSGIGIISDWVPDTAEAPNTTILMPDLYPHENLRLTERLSEKSRGYAIEQHPVDLVVVNLGTNDQSYVRSLSDREAQFERAYGAFLDEIAALRPDTPILCTLGIMGTSLCPAVERAAAAFSERHPKAKCAFFPFPEQLPADSTGADFHPSRVTQQKAAALLTGKIREWMGWTETTEA
ncbi:MAG: hypothetical protein IJ174_05865 [Clostridia bacterium]|nr:hypothetical protein [Clostridia bacterium]